MNGDGQDTAGGRGRPSRDALERLRTQWTRRCQAAQRQLGELASRMFVGQDSSRRARVSVDGDGEVTEVRVVCRQPGKLTGDELAAAVLEAEQIAREQYGQTHNTMFQEMLGVDGTGLARLAATVHTHDDNTAAVRKPATRTGLPEVDELLADAREFRNTSAAFVADLARGSANGASEDRLVHARCGLSGATVDLRIAQELMRRHPSSIEHAIVRAIQDARSAARDKCVQRMNELAASDNPFSGLLAGETRLDTLFARLGLEVSAGKGGN